MSKKIKIALVLALFCTLVRAQRLSNGEYLIKIVKTEKYLSIESAGMANGARMVQWDKGYSREYMFIVTKVSTDVYSLKAKHSNKYISTEGEPMRGAKVIQWDWLDQDNQKWYILPHPSGKGWVMSSYKNKELRMIMQYWNSLVTPQNGAYCFLNDQVDMTPMILDFKKNEVEPVKPPTGVWKGKGVVRKASDRIIN